jgi:hypothetical protein
LIFNPSFLPARTTSSADIVVGCERMNADRVVFTFLIPRGIGFSWPPSAPVYHLSHEDVHALEQAIEIGND